MIDDGSDDDTRRVAQGVADEDPRFRVLGQPRLGLVSTLNQGVRAARAPWVARMDADDLMARHRLVEQFAALHADAGLSGVGCHVRLFPRDGLSGGRRQYELWLNSMRSADDVFRERFVECPLAHPTWLVRRPLLLEFAYRDQRAPEDYDLLLRLLLDGRRLGVVPRRLLWWRDHPGRLSRVDPCYELGRFTWLKALHLSRSFLRGEAEYLLWGYGGTGKALRRALAAHGHRPSHIVELHPGRLGQLIHGARVVAPEALRMLRDRRLIVSVAGAQARRKIRAALAVLGFRDDDFVCAA